MRECLSEKETELRIMKRERDEYLVLKMEAVLENKRLKVYLLISHLIGANRQPKQ